MRSQVQEWPEETHRTGFELRRHFFRRFFDSDLVSTPDQWRTVAGGLIAIVASSSIIVTQEYFGKYRRLLEIDSPEPYRLAMIADHLFFITLGMCLTGLFTCLQWGSLFPGLRDYLALAGLPLRPRDIFTAKFAALVAFAGAFIVAVNALPSAMLPAVSAGRHQVLGGPSMLTLFLSAATASFFLFFALVAFQGLLLNLLPGNLFPRVSLLVQGLLVTALLCALPFVLAIPGTHAAMTTRPDAALWWPPVWFLGLDQWLLGNREPYVSRLAARALIASATAALAALLGYVWSFHRHRIRVIEMPFEPGRETAWIRKLRDAAAGLTAPRSPERAALGFIGKTLARSQQHRLVLTVFTAIAAAIVFNGFVTLMTERGFHGFSVRTFALRQLAASVPLSLTLFLLAGYRYLFRLPVELRANWVFKVNEGGNRLDFLRAAHRTLFWAAVAPAMLLTGPVLVALLGWREGVCALIPAFLAAMILMEMLLFRFDRIPFTSSYLPGQRPLIETVMIYGAAVVFYISATSAVIASAVTDWPGFLMLCGALLAVWAHLSKARIEVWEAGRLEYEETEEPLVHALDLNKD